MQIPKPGGYGDGPASYIAAGEQAGIRRLVDCFYDYMDALPEAATIRAMHPKDLTVSRDKLALFLCGWMGGPKLFAEKYPTTPIPTFHSQFKIGVEERDAWLLCMENSLAEQPYADDFKTYLLEQLYVPAERSRMASEARHAQS
ncbi:MAG: group II truncated hemoglobin [Pseudomonadota bacterium]